jgi:hypothetical protein
MAYGVFANSPIAKGAVLTMFAPHSTLSLARPNSSEYAFEAHAKFSVFEPKPLVGEIHQSFLGQILAAGSDCQRQSRLPPASRLRMFLPAGHECAARFGFLVNHRPTATSNAIAVRNVSGLTPFAYLRTTASVRTNQQIFYNYASRNAALFQGMRAVPTNHAFTKPCAKCGLCLHGRKQRLLHRLSCGQ